MPSKSSITNLLYLSIPIFFANLALPLVAIVDTGLMGNLDKASYLTATSIASSLFSMIFLSFGFLRMGTVGMVAQAHGSKQYNEIVNLVFRNITFVIIISLFLIFLQHLICNVGLQIFDLSNDTEKYFNDYFYIRIYSSFGELTIYVITGLFIGLQKTKISSIMIGFFSVTNIIFRGTTTNTTARNRDYGFWGTLFFLLGFVLAGVFHSESEVDESLYSTKLKILGLEYDTPVLLILCILFAFFLQLTLQYRRVEGLNKFNQASAAIDNIKLDENGELDKDKVDFVKIFNAVRFDMKQTVLWIVSFLFLVSQNIWIILSIFFGAWFGESIAFIHLITGKIDKERKKKKKKNSGGVGSPTKGKKFRF